MKKGITIIFVLLMYLCSTAYAAEKIYRLGDKMENFTFSTYDGKTMSLYDVLEEKDMVLLNIWATWCGPCRVEFPYMEEAYKQYQDQIEVIALSTEPTDTGSVLSAFVEELGLTFKVGQDTSDLFSQFGITSIPLSVIIDRYGVICYIQSGSITSADIFSRLFDAFVGENYTESLFLNNIPPRKPNIAPSREADLTAALEFSTIVNHHDPYTWPMIVTEKDGRKVVASTNSGIDDSTAAITVVTNAQSNDVIEINFKTSIESIADVFSIYVNGEKVKSFTGEHDWMTYAFPVSSPGTQEIILSYAKDSTLSSGNDQVWIDQIKVLSGNAAQEALAANPVYPTSDANSLKAINPTAREISITDPTGLIAAYFGDECRYYIINDETASIKATVTEDLDPETSFFFSNYDRKMTPLYQAMTPEGYFVESGIDTITSTGYEFTNIVIYPDTNSYPAATVMFFKDEENVNRFISNNLKDSTGSIVGSWTYTEDSITFIDPLSRDDGLSDYILKCIDQDGNPVSGVMMQVCNDSTCQVFFTDQNGLCNFTNPSYAWEIHILLPPEGYLADSSTVLIAPVEGGEMVFTLTKQ